MLSKASVIEGLHPADAALVFSTLARREKGAVLWVCRNNRQIEEVAENLRFFLDGQPDCELLLLPGFESDPYRGLSPHPEISAKRSYGLWRLAKGFRGIVLTSIPSLISKTIQPEKVLESCLTLEQGADHERDRILATLRMMGYVREDPVSCMGEYSFRGGIVDVFSPARKFPVRLEFFGDEIDSLREFDPSTQRSIGLVQSLDLVPMREFVAGKTEISAWHRRAPEYWNQVGFAEALSEKLQFTGNDEVFNGFEYLFPLVLDASASLFDYLDRSDSLTLVLSNPDQLSEAIENQLEETQRGYEESIGEGRLALPPDRLFFGPRWFSRTIQDLRQFRIVDFGETADESSSSFDFQMERKYHGRIREMLADLSRWREKGERTVFVMPSAGMTERIAEILGEYDLAVAHCGTFQECLEHSLSVTKGNVSHGFYSHTLKLHVLNLEHVFEERQQVRRPQKPLAAGGTDRFVSDFRDLREGDYVVHIEHGIGIFKGLKHVGVGEDIKEFVVLHYSGDDKLYVPVDRLDLLQKFSSGGTAKPNVDRLGGTSWEKTKRKVKKSMRRLAEDLLKLYARREVAEGHAFSVDDELMTEFEEAFEFEETSDQAAAIRATKVDMENLRPMDRLVCGDVGYGKTEVAMRAAFKAVNDGKQVAVLTPTTVLAYQHFNTFRRRFDGFPVKIAQLSRFLSRKEQKETLEAVGAGLVDVVIGTHRILSADVRFADLGLIVIDEEQRFGVAQKERLKKLRAQVDILTLSATPIPRTLNMSLVGIRDLSIIETPPKDRLAIQTSVVKFSHNIIRSAIDLELKRSGQAFFVHNSIETIYSTAKMIQSIVPEARVAVAHGQMGERALEEVMLGFLRYQYDVLVCTTIIENGLDIPRANTIVVNRSDCFGLSQLYQLRGRVGRSDRRAYAYLLVPGDDVLSTDARKRLAAIKDFSDLGSGFRLAALDMEIRGAGNLLGGEQSGHITAVGFELYVKLLEQAVRELRGEEVEEEGRPSIDLHLNIQIPDHYVPDSNQRLWLYKKVSTVTSDERLNSLREEAIDRFGRLPRAVNTLFDYARLQLQARALKIRSVERKGARVFLKFKENTPVSPERIISLIQEKGNLALSPDGSLAVPLDSTEATHVMGRIFDTIEQISVQSECKLQ